MANTKKAEVTKKPTGLTLTRNKKVFTMGWKIGDADYDDGQSAYFYEHKTGKDNSYNLSPGTTTTSKTHSLNLRNFHPKTSNYLSSVSFKVKGNRKAYTVQKKRKKIKHSPGVSDWSSLSFNIEKPYEPILIETLDSTLSNVTKFSWTSVVSDSDHHIFYDYLVESAISINGALPDWNNPSFRRAIDGIDYETGASDVGSQTIGDDVYSWNIKQGEGYIDITENSARVFNKMSSTFVRYVRVKARGPAGDSDWVTAKHVYAMPAQVTSIKNPSATQITSNQTTSVLLAWTVEQSENIPGVVFRDRPKMVAPGVIRMVREWFEGTKKALHPIDYVKVQYVIQTPKIVKTSSSGWVRSSLQFNPDDANWQDAPGGTISDSKAWDRFAFSIPSLIPEGKTLFVRINTYHDHFVTYGSIVEIKSARAYLTPPSGLVYVDVDDETHMVVIKAPQDNTNVPNAFTAIYFRTNKNAGKQELVAIIPQSIAAGTEVTIQCKAWGENDSPGLGAQSFVADYTPDNGSSTMMASNFTINNQLMWSNGIEWFGSIPIAPHLEVGKYNESPYDTIEASWTWNWNEANAAELSWSDKKDAWYSTAEPSTYVVKGIHASKWHIAGLEPNTWYVRCRFIQETGDGSNYGAYSKVKPVELSTKPSVPALTTENHTVARNKDFTVYWQYANSDGTSPVAAELGLVTAVSNPSGNPKALNYFEYPSYQGTEALSSVTLNGLFIPTTDTSVVSGKTYYQITSLRKMTKTTYEQKETLNPLGLNWSPGTSYILVVRVVSFAGQVSDWGYPLTISVVNPLAASISGSFITSGGVGTLTSLPASVTVSGTGTDGTASVIITRADSYSIIRPELRPDETPIDGFAGETIVLASRPGSGVIEINRDMLIGKLDDGARYFVQGIITDSYGQTAKTENYPFVVNWAHQAIMPEATIKINSNELATMITVPAPTGVVTGDSFDIYRLSADRPELIVSNGVFGTKYVDPYSTLGEFGGHRIVFVSKDGDYITAQNQLAIADYTSEEDDSIDYFGIVIDFGAEQIRLPYDVSVSSKWSKDFTEVKYLGGSVQGYWNPTVSRTMSANSTIVVEEELVGFETIRALRRLAVWPGVCHVRTPDGSSFTANVDVNEDREERWVRRLAKVSLDITRVDSVENEGLTYAEWIATKGEPTIIIDDEEVGP